MARKPLTETTRVTINIEGGPHTEGRRGLIAAVVQSILSHGHLSAAVVEMDRNDEAAAITLETKDFVYDDDGNNLYEEEAEGFTAADPATFGGDRADTASEVPKAERLSYRDAILQAMKSGEDKTEPEPKQADDCDCPACQFRRAVMAFVDKAKEGSDRTETGFYVVTSRGLIRIA